jgi:hypothetical protein
MGVYLVPFDLDELDEMSDGNGSTVVNAVLFRAGLPGLNTIAGTGEGFEEKLIADIESYSRLVDELGTALDQLSPSHVVGAVPHRSPAAVADVWLPLDFSGLLVIPEVAGAYQEFLTIGSSVDILKRQSAIAAEINFPLPSVPPLSPDGYVINDWHEEMEASADPNDPVWRRDPDVAFYVALFWSVAKYSVENNQAVRYT